jgi:hypothetical protein
MDDVPAGPAATGIAAQRVHRPAAMKIGATTSARTASTRVAEVRARLDRGQPGLGA